MYVEAKAAGRWTGYAMTNEREYFAVATTVYFGTSSRSTAGITTKEMLRAYDPALYDFLVQIYC